MYLKVEYNFCLCAYHISDINPIELIGEEIYDEFDFEAANGTISSFVPSEHADTKSFPETETSRSVPQIKDASATPSPVLRPLNTRGINFLRSTSAPPSPCPRSTAPSVFSGPVTRPNTPGITAPAIVVGGPETTTIATTSATDEPEATGKMPKESAHGVIPAFEDSVSDPATPRSVPVKKRPVSSSGTPTPLVGSMSPAVSRSASPAPSLEAILLDRKRRLAAAAAAGRDPGSVTTPSISGTSDNYDARAPAMRPPTMSSKGTRKFKSSPLGGGEQTGVVIAEKVKQDIQGHEEDIRIPDEMNTTGWDKNQDDSGYL